MTSANAHNQPGKKAETQATALVGRQSIYNRKLDVHAYELLYRPASDQNHAGEDFNGSKATSQVMLNTFLELGLDNIVGDKRAFINMTEEFIDGRIQIPLPAGSIVVEVLENINPTPLVIEGLRYLKSKGYVIALDDFVFDEKLMPLVEFADIIKVDLMQISREKLTAHVEALKEKPTIRLLAEKVETLEEFEFCKQLGFDYFQGYFLSKPVIVQGQKMPSNKVAILQLINRLQDPNVEVDELQSLIRNDASLSYKLLRYINSPAYNLDTEVTSIKQALMLIGMNILKRWMTLIVLSGLSDKSNDLIRVSLTRAKMCELLGKVIRQQNIDDYFIVGLFSTLDAMLDQNMVDILHSIPISQPLKEALVRKSGKIGKVLNCVIAYEHGDWENLHSGTITNKTLQTAYLESVAWAENAMSGLT